MKDEEEEDEEEGDEVEEVEEEEDDEEGNEDNDYGNTRLDKQREYINDEWWFVDFYFT